MPLWKKVGMAFSLHPRRLTTLLQILICTGMERAAWLLWTWFDITLVRKLVIMRNLEHLCLCLRLLREASLIVVWQSDTEDLVDPSWQPDDVTYDDATWRLWSGASHHRCTVGGWWLLSVQRHQLWLTGHCRHSTQSGMLAQILTFTLHELHFMIVITNYRYLKRCSRASNLIYEYYVRWWLGGRFSALHSEGHRFKSHSSRHVEGPWASSSLIVFCIMWCGDLCGSLAVKFDSCNNLLSIIHSYFTCKHSAVCLIVY